MRRVLTRHLAEAFAVLFLFAESPRAESDISLCGEVIDDSTGAPVEQASVRIEGTAFAAFTESDGSFVFRAVTLGSWTVTVERSGYHARRIEAVDIVEGFTRRLQIALKPDPIVVGAQRVQASPTEFDNVRRIIVADSRAGSRSVAELLQSVPGVRVYGSSDAPGGTRISVGGEPPSRVAVMLDGLPLSGGADGAVDLSAIPVAAITEIEIHPGSQTVIAGDAAVGGAVNLITRADRQSDVVRLALSGGEWGRTRQDLSIRRALNRLVLSGGGEYDQRRDPYKFVDPKSDTIGMRQNSRLDERRLFLKVTAAAPRSFELLGYASRNERGAPGTIERPLQLAFTRNKNARLQSAREFALAGGHHLTAAAWFEYGSEYYNASNERIPQLSYIREQFIGLRTGDAFTLYSIDCNSELEVRSRSIYGLRERSEYALRVRFNKSTRRFSLYGGLALDADQDNAPGWSPRLDIRFTPWKLLSMGLGWGRSFKRPLLLTAFWKGDYYTQGNPNLLPERAEEWDAGIRVRHRFITIESRYFEREINDIIVWDLRGVPQKYTPVNLASGRIIGREDYLVLNSASGDFSLNYTHVYNNGTDQSGQTNYEGKTLPFTPRHTHDLSVRGSFGPLAALLTGRWVSKREGLRSNTNRWQTPYRVIDAEIRFSPSRQTPRADLFLRGDNLTDEAYELLQGYPSPARTLSAGVTIELK